MSSQGRSQPLAPNPQSLVATLTFALTLLLGIWAAYDRPAAYQRAALLGAGLALLPLAAWAGRRWCARALFGLAIGAALLAVAVAAYYLLAATWAEDSAAKFAVLQRAGGWWQAHRPAIPLPEDINANTAGNALAVLLPLSAGATIYSWCSLRSQRKLARSGTGQSTRSRRADRSFPLLGSALTLALAFACVALILTASRGAWIGLAAGAAAALVAGLLGRRLASRSAALGATLVIFVLLAAGMFAVFSSPAIAARLGSVGGSAIGRGILWRDMLAQIGDYPFTGSGLAATMMVDATYFRLLHVGYISHAHNLFLQLAIEQGLIGLAAFVGILAAAFYALFRAAGAVRVEGGAIRLFALAGITSLVAQCVHGLVDTGVYAAKIAPLLFVPLAFALAVAEARPRPRLRLRLRLRVRVRRRPDQARLWPWP